MMYRLSFVALAIYFAIKTVSYANTPAYDSLEHFCLATKSDTPENCACGQAKADDLLTPEEQQLVIGLMTQDPIAMGKIMQMEDQGQSLMQKINEITQGCD